MSAGPVRIGVIGAGTMGHGIAQVAALAGHTVVLADESRELALQGIERVRENLDGGVARGKVKPEARDAALSRISAGTGLVDAATGAALVIEAVPERMELKRAVFAEADAVAPPDAVLATNTSSLSITDIQSGTARPGRVIGMHFFNPVHINALVEVVRGRQTSAATVGTALDFVAGIGKEAVLVNDSPGFATSRLGVLLGLEAMRMVEEGVATAEDIDRAMVLGYRHPMGPLRLTDLVGLDIRLAIAEYLFGKLGAEHFRPPQILRDMVADGRLGRKSGHGFYDWTEGA
jgi:3-hydroxybutyryl-CoA dehydrogenase